MGQLYLEIYTDLRSCLGDSGQSILENTIKWLLCARRRLCVPELLWAIKNTVCVVPKDINLGQILDLCRNLVTYDEGLDVLRFSHLSVREFFESMKEFAGSCSNIVASESCLLQLFALSDAVRLPQNPMGRNIRDIRQRSKSANTSSATEFVAYAQAEWMNHCKSVLPEDRLSSSPFRRLLESFLDTKSGPGSAMVAWVRWYCSRLTNNSTCEAYHQLQNALVRHPNSVTQSLFIAITYGFNDIVTANLYGRVLSDEEQHISLMLAAMASEHEIFDLLLSEKANSVVTEPMLFYTLKNTGPERLARLLDKVDGTRLSPRVMAAASRGHAAENVALILERCPNMPITQQILEKTITQANGSAFELILARADDQFDIVPLVDAACVYH